MTENYCRTSFGKPNILKHLILGDCMFGKAVFAAELIYEQEKILEFGGDIFSSKKLPYPYDPEKDFFLQIGEDEYLGPTGEIDDYINHSCAPNCGIRIQSNTVELIAIATIQPGEQITFNYSTTMNGEWGHFNCSCGSNDCCGMVKNFLELPPQIQKKYIGLNIVPNYILDKVSNI